ncbi:MAG: hypothetical protein QOC72_3958 [Methylobacteriaceae bacterium]|nr:hypothetical protein [Methylobacteriaceae bacterium]
MLAGTSTGGIIVLGLAMGMTAMEVFHFYLKYGREIFPRTYSSFLPFRKLQELRDTVSAIRRYRYEREPLERRLRGVLGDRKFGELERRVIIPSFDGFTEVNLFKTPHHPDYKLDWKERLLDIALATSAAPTFFSVYKSGERRFADGGVWANNPVMTALVDALVCYKLERRQVQILSLGCAESEFQISKGQVQRGGLWHWREIISSAMRLQSQNALGQAGLLIGRDHVTRLDAQLMVRPIALDDYERAAEELPPLAIDLVRENEAALRAAFASVRPSFRAYHGPRASAAN